MIILCIEHITTCVEKQQELTGIFTGISGSSIVEQAIGAFIGFALALVGAWFSGKIAKKMKIRSLKKRVYLELTELYSDIKSPRYKNTLLSYDFPIWDSVISSAILLDIGNNTFLQSLVAIYGRLKILQDSEHKMLLEDEEQKPTPEVLKKRDNLVKFIEDSEHYKQIKINIKNNTK